MKRICKCLLMLIAMLVMTCSVAFAEEKIGIVLEAPLDFCNDAEVQSLIDTKASSLFPKDRFKVMSTKDSVEAAANYRKNNKMSDVIGEGRGGYTMPMRKDNVKAFGESIGANYVLFFKLSNDAPKYGTGFYSTSVKANIICEIRVMNVAKDMFTVNKQIVEKGKSTAVYAGLPSFNHAYKYAFTKALQMLTLDVDAM